jgi:hypothetical protein
MTVDQLIQTLRDLDGVGRATVVIDKDQHDLVVTREDGSTAAVPVGR